jgi:hypothetical protein
MESQRGLQFRPHHNNKPGVVGEPQSEAGFRQNRETLSEKESNAKLAQVVDHFPSKPEI